MTFGKSLWKKASFFTRVKNVSLCSDQCWAVWPGDFTAWRKLYGAIFSDTLKAMNVKLCMVVVLIEPYPSIWHSVTLIIFQGHSYVNSCNWNVYVFIRLTWDFVGLSSPPSRSWNYAPLSLSLSLSLSLKKKKPNKKLSHAFKRDSWHISSFANFNVSLLSDTIKARSFKLRRTGSLHCHFKFDDIDLVSRSRVC